MKSQMSSFDIAAVVRELQACVGMKAEKFFLQDYRTLFFRLTGPAGKNTVLINLDHGIWLEEGFRTTGDSEPPTFAMLLRKHLSNRALKSVRQHGFDRIVVFEFEGEPAMRFVAELFGSGNLLLLDGDRIIQPLTSKSWKARDVKAGKEYLFPPESRDPFLLERQSLAEILKTSRKDLIRCLATEANLGGAYAEEVCFSLGRGKNDAPAELNDDDIGDILDIIRSFKDGLDAPAPHILVGHDGGNIDVLPFELGMHESLEREPYPSFSLAARDYFETIPERMKGPEKSHRQLQLERQLESQTEALTSLEARAVECQEAGDRVYANYALLDGILQSAEKILGGGNWQALRKDVESITHVKGFDPAGGMVSVSLPDGSAAELDVRKNLNQNAAELYDRAKRAKQKAEGAREAIKDTERLLRDVSKAEEEARRPDDKRPTKRFWFDKFRWFLSSEGFMVVGGRDTRTNDQVVKKHLKDGDLYAHADANGAPSVVIKEGARATEATLEEACTFAVAFSRAWKSKLASGSAYWVKPDQVSKTPQPGEFVPKGAFIIRGKRNYSKKIEIRLAVAMVKVQGADKVMCGPVSAVKAHATEFLMIEPGDERRSDFAKMLSDLYNVPIEEIDRVLPAGDVRIVTSQ